MIKNSISLVLLIVSVTLNFKHGWDAFHYKDHPESAKMMSELGISGSFVPFLALFIVLIAVLLLIPQTYFLGNLLNAVSILFIMCLAARVGNFKMALLEIPFLAIPVIMIALKYPFKN
ncbi:hypothetical protein [Mucilaginibacter sp. 22184]|uniref:hypothetical protein n=1 Tax=Mucilaginibacter sp. 22184 TaxID=3453887 RepID=UPI003F86F4BA